MRAMNPDVLIGEECRFQIFYFSYERVDFVICGDCEPLDAEFVMGHSQEREWFRIVVLIRIRKIDNI